MKSSKSRACLRLAAAALVAVLASCGGGGGGGSTTLGNGSGSGSGSTIATPTTNAAQIVVDSGPVAVTCTTQEQSNGCTVGQAIGTVNIAFVTVNVCLPGTTTCQSIDHVMVDTGSSGLRLMASAFTSVASTNYSQVQTNSSGLYECEQFADGFTWGSVRVADVKIAGETASSQNIQIVGDSSSGTPPSACSGTGTELDDAFAFGANGVLGVGLFINDCITGYTCPTGQNLYFYFNCSSISSSTSTPSTCTESTATATQQVANPVASFTTDNNGVIVELPSVVAGGATTATGSLVFGINTETNNTTAQQAVYLANSGAVTTAQNFAGDFFSTLTNTGGFGGTGTPWGNSFFDSGSNGIFLPGTSIPCDNTYGWFVPSSTLALSANLQGETGASAATGTVGTLTFTIASMNTLFATTNAAFDDLGGPTSTCSNGTGTGTSTADNGGIDWGLPTFYGRNIYVGLETNSITINGTAYSAPLWAF